MNKLKIMFLRDERNHPVGCLVMDVDNLAKTVDYQISVLNPLDSFKRPVARQLAIGRMYEKPLSTTFKGKTVHEAILAVMKDIAKSKAPSRARKSAKNWIKMSDTLNNVKGK